MKIFEWMQNKLNGRHGNKKSNSPSVNQPPKEEFSDWPHGLLAIGTFGYSATKNNLAQENPSPSQDHTQDIKPEEVELQNDLVGSNEGTEIGTSSALALDNRHRSLEEERKEEADCSDGPSSTSVVLTRRKDNVNICVDTTTNGINKKSSSFLLKKFVCSSGFTPAPPSLRDQVPESRMEKILRAILHKKIYPQGPSPTLSREKFLENNYHRARRFVNDDDDMIDELKADVGGSKWVKTDSEYIVLEI